MFKKLMKLFETKEEKNARNLYDRLKECEALGHDVYVESSFASSYRKELVISGGDKCGITVLCHTCNWSGTDRFNI